MFQQLIDQIIAAAWLLLILLSMACTFVCSILALVLKDKPKAVAIDILLVLATTVIVLFQLSTVIPAFNKETKFSVSSAKKAEYVSIDLLIDRYISDLNSPWKELSIPAAGWDEKEDKYKSVVRSLNKYRKKNPDNAEIASKLAIVLHEFGDSPDQILTSKKLASKPVIKFLSELYSKEKIKEYSLSPEEIDGAFPAGWFREAVLKEYFEKTSAPDKLKELLSAARNNEEAWQERYKFYVSLNTAFSLVGLFALWLYYKKRPGGPLPRPIDFGFRKAYGCVLAYIYTECISEFIISLAIGLSPQYRYLAQHPELPQPNYQLIMMPYTTSIGVATTFLFFYFLCCRPIGQSVLAIFNEARISKGMVKGICTAALGFSVFVLFSSLITVLTLHGEGNSSEAMWEFVDSFINMNFSGIFWTCFLFCIVAPFTEELLFRVLLYPYFRNKWGVFVGIVLSALLFALIHLNPQSLLYYFSGGVVLAAVYERTRSYPTVVGIHCFWNAWAVFSVACMITK